MDTLIILVFLQFLVLQSVSLCEHTEISVQSLKHPELCPPCNCEAGTAICNSLGLTYIPKFPNGTRKVTFTRNSLKSITERTFSNLSHLNLLDLDLSDNDIRSISPEAFSTLRRLQNLCLRNNTVPITILSESFLGLRNLISLNLRHMLLRNISSGFFKYLPSLSLEHLDISHNGLKQFNFDSLTKFPDLKILRVGHNPIRTIQWKYYNALEEVSFDDCYMQEIPTFCSGNGSFFPKLKKFFFSHNFLIMLNATFFSCLDTLEVTFLNNNPIRVIDSGTFAYLPNLKEVSMHHMEQLNFLHDYAFNNTNLGILNLRGSHLGVNEIRPSAFAGCYGLHTLDLGYNQFEFMDDSIFNQLFRDLNSLRNLTLTSSELTAVPSVISRVMFRLESLSMNKNKLQGLPRNMFHNLTKLTRLNVSCNFIIMIQEDTFPEQSRNTLKHIGLEHNSFTCSCDMKWFILWIQRDHHKFTGYPSFYACAYPSEFRSVLLSDVSFSEQYCLFQKTVYVLLLGFITLGVLLVAVVSIIYKCRWRLRYFLYLVRHLDLYKPRDDQDCTYDGFVVYSPSDTAWITQHLIPCLEERNGLTLCIHERDFDVGGAIVDNIVENVEASRKILIVLSVNSLQSEWCLFEINFAQRRAVGGAHTFVVVLLGNIPGRLISSSMRVMLEEHPCLVWPAQQEDESARDMFWEQVVGYFRH